MNTNIQRIQRIGLSCSINDNGKIRHFHNGHEYVEIGGIKWATMNVGAKSITDYGQKFSWGGVNGYTHDQISGDCHSKAYSWSDYELGNSGVTAADITKYNSTDGKMTLEASDDAATFNMGVGWRTPTKEEFKSLVDSTTSIWVTNYQGSGINGRLFTDKTDISKKLFFPAVGYCYDGSVDYVGEGGYYWSSSLYGDYALYAWGLLFYNEGAGWVDGRSRSYGCAVRGVVG